MSVTSVYELPVPIWVSRTVLGRRFSSGYGSLPFEVVMPTDEGPCGTPPQVEGIEVPTRKDDSSELLMWTHRFAAQLSDPDSTALCRIMVKTQGPDNPLNAPYDLARAIDPWFDAVRTWAECVTGQDLDPHHQVFSATSHGARLTVLDPPPQTDGPIAMSLETPRVSPVSAQAWPGMMSSVAAGRKPPLEEQLSRDARAAFRRNQLRRATIDAASAVEMVLFKLINEDVEEADMPNSDFRRKLERLEKQPLGELVAIAEKAPLDLGADLQQLKDLVDIRNDSIHRGQTPDYWAAFTGIQAAVDLLTAHSRWRRPGDLDANGIDWHL